MLKWLKTRWYAMRSKKDIAPSSMGEKELVWRVQEMGRELDELRDKRRQFSAELRNRLGGA